MRVTNGQPTALERVAQLQDLNPGPDKQDVVRLATELLPSVLFLIGSVRTFPI